MTARVSGGVGARPGAARAAAGGARRPPWTAPARAPRRARRRALVLPGTRRKCRGRADDGGEGRGPRRGAPQPRRLFLLGEQPPFAALIRSPVVPRAFAARCRLRGARDRRARASRCEQVRGGAKRAIWTALMRAEMRAGAAPGHGRRPRRDRDAHHGAVVRRQARVDGQGRASRGDVRCGRFCMNDGRRGRRGARRQCITTRVTHDDEKSCAPSATRTARATSPRARYVPGVSEKMSSPSCR